MSRHIATFAALWLALGCGADKKTDKEETTTDKDKATTPATGDAAATRAEYEDAEVVGQSVGAQLEEGVSMAMEENDSGDAFGLAELELADVAKTRTLTRSRLCVEEGATAIVNIKAHRLFEREVSGPVRTAALKREGYREVVRTWSKDGGSIKCAENKKHALLLKGEDFTGLSLKAKGKRYREESGSFEHKAKDFSLSRSRKANVSFERNVKWDAVTKSGDSYTINKTVSSSGTRSLEVVINGTKKGKTRNLTKSFTSAFKADGLKVVTVRNAAGKFLSRTVNGVLEAENTHADGKVVLVKTTLIDAKYEGKKLVSGSVEATFTLKGETVPFKTAKGTIGTTAGSDDSTVAMEVKDEAGNAEDVEVTASGDVDGDESDDGATESESVEKPASAT